MLNSTKLLYILPDVAYIAELLPTKKPHSFAIQAFRQINGTFINDDEFIAENVEKLIKKIDADEYHLILPDFLFTNTIVDVAHTSESGVKKYLKEELLPSLGLAKETHEIDTFILTQHGGKSKVQLSALEKSLLTPIQRASEEQKVKISHISPLSWTIKSVISLEPSLSTIQMGGMMYVSQHYIGIDQTISYSIDETANIIETVKTLKGAEPNIQTMYLLTNPLLENEIKEKLSGTLPIQQLASYTDEQEGIPAHIKQIIEAGAKTLDITEHAVPRFALGKGEGSNEKKADVKNDTPAEAAEEKPTEKDTPMLNIPAEPTDLPAPTPPPVAPVAAAAVEEVVETLGSKTMPEPEVKPAAIHIEVDSVDETSEEAVKDLDVKLPGPIAVPAPKDPTLPEEVTPIAPFSYPPVPKEDELPQVVKTAAVETTMPIKTSPMVMPPAPSLHTPQPPFAPTKPATRPVIKNKNDAAALFRVVVITAGALLATVGIGIGIGFGVLKLSEGGNTLNHTPVVATSATPVASAAPALPSPSPSPVAATIDKATFKILVVNATTISGKAGKVKSSLTAAGYKNVDTGNAKGKYDEGTYLLVEESNPGQLATIEKDSTLDLTEQTDKTAEDAKDAYDVVIVLAE